MERHIQCTLRNPETLNSSITESRLPYCLILTETLTSWYSTGNLNSEIWFWRQQEASIEKRLEECEKSSLVVNDNLSRFRTLRDKTETGIALARSFNKVGSQFGKRDIARSFQKLVRRCTKFRANRSSDLAIHQMKYSYAALESPQTLTKSQYEYLFW